VAKTDEAQYVQTTRGVCNYTIQPMSYNTLV